MKKMVLFITALALVSHFSLSPAKLIPASWVQDYHQTRDFICLLVAAMEPGCGQKKTAVQPPECVLAEARVAAMEIPPTFSGLSVPVRLPEFTLPSVAERQQIADEALRQYDRELKKLDVIKVRVRALELCERKAPRQHRESIRRAISAQKALLDQEITVL